MRPIFDEVFYGIRLRFFAESLPITSGGEA